MEFNNQLVLHWINVNQPNGVVKLAAKSEVSVATLNKILRLNHMPTVNIIERLASAMGVDFYDLLVKKTKRGDKTDGNKRDHSRH